MSNERKRKTLFIWFTVIIGMILIYNLSAQPASQSNQLSKGVAVKVVEMAEKIIPSLDLNTDRINHIVRKNAHFFSYLVLASMVLLGLRKGGLFGIKAMSITLLICVLYAITDEVHQLFVPGRGGQVKDVFIDSAGAIAGIFFCSLTIRIKQYILARLRR